MKKDRLKEFKRERQLKGHCTCKKCLEQDWESEQAWIKLISELRKKNESLRKN